MKHARLIGSIVPAALTVALAAGMVGCTSPTAGAQDAANSTTPSSAIDATASSASEEASSEAQATSSAPAAEGGTSSTDQSSSAATSSEQSTKQNRKKNSTQDGTTNKDGVNDQNRSKRDGSKPDRKKDANQNSTQDGTQNNTDTSTQDGTTKKDGTRDGKQKKDRGNEQNNSTTDTQNSTNQNTKQQSTNVSGDIDYQPGQTTDKGYTANDAGIAITATLNAAEAFTEAELAQTIDTANATVLNLADGQDLTVSTEGVTVIKGSASESRIVVDAPDTATVQLVLDNVSINNSTAPAIYVKSAKEVLVTLQGDNTLSVSKALAADGETQIDGVVFSQSDLCFKGTGKLSVNSTDNAIVSAGDLVVTSGTYALNAEGSALRANDSVRVANGDFTIKAADGIKAKNDADNELGYVYIKDGTFNVTTTDNGIQGYAFVWIDGGTFKLDGAECIEGTYIQINDGHFDISASDDAINASIKSSVYTPTLEITGGEMTINMASGDTDALDSNGYLYIKDGTLNLNAQSPFDYVWGAEMTGGEVFVNGQQVTEITQSMMGGGFGGRGGNMPTPPTGEAPSTTDGQAPSMPDGSMPTPPNGEAPTMPDGQMPTPPDGQMMTPPDGQAPTMPDGNMPTPPNGQAPAGPSGQAPNAAQNQGTVATPDQLANEGSTLA